MGDFLRGVDRSCLSDEILLGIKNHQFVDSFTDKHPAVCYLRKTFSKDKRRFSSIAIDITFDHFLIREWERFSSVEFEEFVSIVEIKLKSQKRYMSERMWRVVNLLFEHRIFHSYNTIAGVENALDRTASRVKVEHNFYGAIDDVLKNYNLIENAFSPFFEELIVAVKNENIEQGVSFC
jgi:acyl carrier protein phosphodiesterase